MPFDGKEVQFETPALRRARLIEALREPMPANFTWDFDSYFLDRNQCGYAGCAIGLMSLVFPGFTYEVPDRDRTDRTYRAAAEFLGISLNQAKRCFSTDYYSCARVSPKRVADALEKIG